MPTTYTIEVDEGPGDLAFLTGNNYDLAVAKAVATDPNDTTGTTNTIYMSSTDLPNKKPSNQNTISWTEDYALAYTSQPPVQGAIVRETSDWQSMSLGDSYTIDSNGNWTAGSGGASTSLNVTNKFQDIHIIVGIMHNGSYRPIFIDRSALGMNMSGTYIPLENISMWWAADQHTSMVIATQESASEAYTLQSSDTVYFWYDSDKGVWKSQSGSGFPGNPAGTPASS